ncbi:MAG: hypothetical protein ACK5Y2_05710 [Bdellovibrionales bacterium]
MRTRTSKARRITGRVKRAAKSITRGGSNGSRTSAKRSTSRTGVKAHA